MKPSPARPSLLLAAGAGAALVAALAQAQPPPPAGGGPPAAGERKPAAPAPAEGPGADLERLRAEHSALKDALFRSRARRETLENALLSTQLIPVVRWDGARRYLLKSA